MDKSDKTLNGGQVVGVKTGRTQFETKKSSDFAEIRQLADSRRTNL